MLLTDIRKLLIILDFMLNEEAILILI